MARLQLERSVAALDRSFVGVVSLAQRLVAPVSSRIRRVLRQGAPEGPAEPYVAGVTPISRALARPAVLGFIASVSILFGASQPNSPFTLKLSGAWFFGLPAVSAQPQVFGETPRPGQGLFLGVLAVYGGMILMLRAWYDIVQLTSRHPGIPVSRLVPVFAAWVLPLLVVAPLFSRDLYSYAAQGEMVSHGINPYTLGPNVISTGNPWGGLVDPLWGNVTAPYGPLFEVLAGGIVVASGHHDLVAVEGLRLLALVGVVLFAVAIPSIARSFHRDGATAFALAALNPLVLLHLVGGGHNDALMLGLLVAGYALARRNHQILGILVCGLAASVKVPALIGAVYIGWEWLGHGRTTRERLRPTATALLIALGTMAVLSEAARLGWGWISGLSNPDTVRSWLDPSTGIALFIGHFVSVAGLGNHTHLLLTLTRTGALGLAALIGRRMLVRSEEIGSLRALGWSLTAIVVLSPVIQPWYAAWGFVFLAPIAEGTVRRVLVVISGVACFVGLPGGRVLIDELGIANPLLVAVASAALVSFGLLLLVPRLRNVSGHTLQPLEAERV